MPSLPHATADTFAAAFNAAIDLHKAGDIAGAAARYEQLRDIPPENPELLYLLGGAYVQLRRPREGLGLLERSLALRPGYVPALDLAGSAWIAAGEPERALHYFRESAHQASAPYTAIERLAAALLNCGRHAEALTEFERCLALAPTNAKACTGAGIALANLNRTTEAEAMLRRCLDAHPAHVRALVALGKLLGVQERYVEAEKYFRSAIDLASTDADAQYWLAISLHKQARTDEAITAYARARELDPINEKIAIQMAEALIDLLRIDEAQAVLNGIASAIKSSTALTARGRIEELRGNLQQAIALHEQAIAADPGNEAAYINRGSARRFSGDYVGALGDYDAALAIKPGVAAAIANRGLTLLTLGRLSEAWPYYRSRIRAQGNAIDLTGDRPWDGRSIAGKRVLVWTEYGVGDEILFASMLPQVIDEAAHCALVCSPRLVKVFKRSFPEVDVIARGAPIGTGYDVHVALTDLAQRFRPDLKSFSPHQGYLKADATRVAELRSRYGAGRKRVGISWRSASGATGGFKSAPLAQWSKILSAPGITYVSLQYGDPRSDILQLEETSGAKILIDPNVDPLGDLDDFTAQVAAMDLVISVSNTTVHVAGALGVPVWILVPEGPGAHWYWFRDRADSPWYPSARLFRQKQAGDWSAPIEAVAATLNAWAARP